MATEPNKIIYSGMYFKGFRNILTAFNGTESRQRQAKADKKPAGNANKKAPASTRALC